MAIRVQMKGSEVYHLQRAGHAYWRTMCSRASESPAFTDADGVRWPLLTIMSGITEAEARKLRLCKKCRAELEMRYGLEMEGKR